MDFSFLNNDKILGGDEKQSAQEILEKNWLGLEIGRNLLKCRFQKKNK